MTPEETSEFLAQITRKGPSNASGLPVQKTPEEPGHEYATLAVAKWVAGNDVYLAVSNLGAFAFMNAGRAKKITRDELSVITRFRYQVRDAAGAGVAIARVGFDDDLRAELGPIEATAPDGAPAGWFETISSLLLQFDIDLEAWAAEKHTDEDVRRELAAEHMVVQARRTLVDEPEPEGGFTHSLYARRDTAARTNIKRGKEIVARLFSDTGVLQVEDERLRRAVVKYCLANDLHPLPPVNGDVPPTVRLSVMFFASWAAYSVERPNSFGDGLRIGRYYPATKSLQCSSDAWWDEAVRVLEWHGLPVEKRAFVSPPGCGMFVEQAAVDTWKRRNAVPMPTRHTVAAKGSAAPDIAARMAEVEKWKAHKSAEAGRKPLPDDIRNALPAEIADAFDAWVTATEPGERGPTGYRADSTVLSKDQIEALKAAIEPVRLPDSAVASVEWATASYPDHVLLMAAYHLRTNAPAWWSELPWVPGNRRRPGEPVARPAPDKAPTPVFSISRYDIWAARLADFTPAQAIECGQPELINLLKREKFPTFRMEEQLDQDDQGRLYIAAAALAHAGYGQPDAKPDEPHSCAACQGVYYPGNLHLGNLLYVGSSLVCQRCLHLASWGFQTNLIPITTQARVAAIQALAQRHGTLISRAVLDNTLGSSDDPTDTAVELILRSMVPRDNAEKSWGEWLEQAGLVIDGWRPSYGVYSTAADGHRCRSLMERHIDDWMFHAGIPHTPEPDYPWDAELNPNGFRADWRIGTTFVEAAGMMGNASYAAKMAVKQQLADLNGFELVVITDADLGNLEELLGRFRQHA